MSATDFRGSVCFCCCKRVSLKLVVRKFVPKYLLFNENVETVASDERETIEKIFNAMRQGMRNAREK